MSFLPPESSRGWALPAYICLDFMSFAADAERRRVKIREQQSTPVCIRLRAVRSPW